MIAGTTQLEVAEILNDVAWVNGFLYANNDALQDSYVRLTAGKY